MIAGVPRPCSAPFSVAASRTRRFAGEGRPSMAVSGEGETRSVYVVQRHFRLVRRGYDPVEVDRHLQVVSEWFRQSRAGETAREREKQLQARERAVAGSEERAHGLLESKRREAEATLEGARLRVKADIEAATRTLERAEAASEQSRQAAKVMLEQAGEEAERLRAVGFAERSAILDQARLDAAAASVVREAQVRAQRIVADAEAQAERVVAEIEQRSEQELATARSAAQQLLAAMRAQATEDVRALRAQGEQEVRAYAERRHREIDRLVNAARRERRRSDGDPADPRHE